MNSKLHIAMFPWFAYGHFIPYLYLANKLAEKGHIISFLLPKSAQCKLEQQNQHPDLINFYPVLVPHVDGLPPGAETNSEVPLPLLNSLFSAFDKTQPQVQSYLSNLKPDFVLYDFAFWVPSLSRRDESGGLNLNFKSICYQVMNTVLQAFYIVPYWKQSESRDFMKPPPDFPSNSIFIKHLEAAQAHRAMTRNRGELSIIDRLITSMEQSDAIAMRTCYEIEGSFSDYIADQYKKLVLFTGPALPDTTETQLEKKWADWLDKFEVGSVVYCSFGTQTVLQKTELQELVLGLELTGLPFLVALPPPQGCGTIEEALPEGFEERVEGRGCVYGGGWVPQQVILQHPAIGCFVSHCGYGAMWEWLMLSECQIVLIPQMLDHVMGTRLMTEVLKVAVEVEREEKEEEEEEMWISKESLSDAIKMVIDEDSGVSGELRRNHAKLRSIICSKEKQESYINNFIHSLQDLMDSKK